MSAADISVASVPASFRISDREHFEERVSDGDFPQESGVSVRHPAAAANAVQSESSHVPPASHFMPAGDHIDLTSRLIALFGVFTPGMFALAAALGSMIFAPCVPNLPLPPVVALIFVLSQGLFSQNWKNVSRKSALSAFVLLVFFCGLLLSAIKSEKNSDCAFFFYMFCIVHFLGSVAFTLFVNINPVWLATRSSSTKIIIEWCAPFLWCMLAVVGFAAHLKSLAVKDAGLSTCDDCSKFYFLVPIPYALFLGIAVFAVYGDALA